MLFGRWKRAPIICMGVGWNIWEMKRKPSWAIGTKDNKMSRLLRSASHSISFVPYALCPIPCKIILACRASDMIEKSDAIAVTERATDSKVEKIREILIGAQMETIERRIEEIEKRIEREIVSVRRQGEMRWAALESALNKEITELSGRYQRMLGTYENVLRSMETAVANSHDEIAKQISSLDARFFEQGTAFREQLHRQATELRSSLQALRTELVGLLVSEQREDMIKQAAYRRAERRGFAGGDPQQDWREAEAEVERALQEKIERIKTKAQAADLGSDRDGGAARSAITASAGGQQP